MPDENAGFPRLDVERKKGDERFCSKGKPLDFNLLGFWRWSASDLVSNAMCGILAEYIVANALGIADGLRTEWDAFDLLTKDGIKIEVKSAAYLQSWYHKELSKITFSIRQTRLLDANTNELSTELKRQADIYVFCILHHQEKHSINPLNLDQWTFYILRSSVLDEKLLIQKTLRLAGLLKLNPHTAKYEELAGYIERISNEIRNAN